MIKRFVIGLSYFLLSFILFYSLFQVTIPKSDSLLTKRDFLKQKSEHLSYVAIGDSLTAGVGDTTNQGGYVSMLAQEMGQSYGYEVTSFNYGVSGNTSKQILKRMKRDKTIQNKLAHANLLTVTVGGNDVMAVIQKELSDLEISDFTKASVSYQERVRQIIDLARKDNPDLPIYILGIYNPFYLNFPEIQDMQTVIDNWNKATEVITKEYDKVYFVPINDLIYKGIEGQEGLVQTVGDQTTIINDALFSEDHFHPNHLGYQIMTNAVMEVIRETKENW